MTECPRVTPPTTVRPKINTLQNLMLCSAGGPLSPLPNTNLIVKLPNCWTSHKDHSNLHPKYIQKNIFYWYMDTIHHSNPSYFNPMYPLHNLNNSSSTIPLGSLHFDTPLQQ